jgi:hypothetical protein
LINRTRHPSVLVVSSFRGADSDTGRNLVVAEDRERLAVNKKKFHMARSNLKKLKEAEVKEQYQVDI